MPKRSKIINLYKDLWRKGIYNGFSEGTKAQESNILLSNFIELLKTTFKERVNVIEVGAGSGYHSLEMAKNNNFNVFSIDSSENALQKLQNNSSNQELGSGSNLTIIHDDFLNYLEKISNNTIHGFYANSVFHFLNEKDRKKAYILLSELQPQNGIIAISFKATGDSLEQLGEKIADDSFQNVVVGEDGIQRSFIKDIHPLIKEAEDQGYSLMNLYSYEVRGYNIQNKIAKFIGFIAQKR